MGLEGVTDGCALLVGSETYNFSIKNIVMVWDKDDFIPARIKLWL